MIQNIVIGIPFTSMRLPSITEGYAYLLDVYGNYIKDSSGEFIIVSE